MNWVKLIGILVFIYSLLGLLIGLYQLKVKQNPYGLSPWLNPLGAFVYGDAVMFGALWMVLSASVYLSGSPWWLGLIVSLFWLVRSVGETGYWLLQQFAREKRDKPEDLTNPLGFPGESIYFAYQIFWQSVSVICLLASIYFVHRWWG